MMSYQSEESKKDTKGLNPILVTGSHRGGTTWVGRMIASHPSIAYIKEPFHIHHDIGIYKARFDYWFTYICEENESDYYQDYNNMLEFRYNLLEKLKSTQSGFDRLRAIKRWTEFSYYRIAHRRPLLKDPLAVFSAEWISSRFNIDTVVVIRHPAAFAVSVRAKNWGHDFSNFIKQPLLMDQHLHPFEKEIREFIKEEKDIIDQAALLWKLIHYMILDYRNTHKEWTFVRHEDLSRDPVNGFRSLFEKLSLSFSEHEVGVISRHSFAHDDGDVKPGKDFKDIKRDSAANIEVWKSRLTQTEIARVKYRVEEISKEFYSEDEW